MSWEKILETLTSLGLAGLFWAFAVHYFLNFTNGKGGLGQALTFACLGTIAAFFAKILGKVRERLEEPIANWLVRQLERLWLRLTSRFQSQYYQDLIYTYRDYRTQGLKTKGPFTLDLEKVFVPLRIAPESAERISPEMVRVGDSARGLSIWDFLAASQTQQAFRTLAIIGAPGSGKTTLLEHLTLTYAKNSQRRQNRQAPKLLPILLYLRDVREEIANVQPDSQPKLAELIPRQPAIQKLKPPAEWFEEALRRQPCLVMLDGLDEVADEQQRQTISRWVNQQIQHYPQARFLLTSRPFGYQNAPVEAVGTVLEVQPFNLEQMQQFIHNWYLQREIMSHLGKDDLGIRQAAQRQAEDLIHRIQHNSPLAAMAFNPLLLTMIATVHCYRGALPGRRVELYGEICDVLLGRRREAKGIADTLSASQKKAVLQVLALALMEQESRQFTPAHASRLIEDKLANVAGTSLTVPAFLEKIETESGLLVEREKAVYEFAHKSFQEYLAAAEIQKSNREDLIAAHINEGWWEETIRLYAAQSDATNLIRAALEHPTVTSLKLAYDCLEERLEVQPEVAEQLKNKLEAGLESPEPEIAQLAAQVKLARRLSQLLRVDENLEIDRGYITCAEYQLFLGDLTRGRSRDVTLPMTEISGQDVLEFLGWLNVKAPAWMRQGEQTAYYRLPTATEAVRISADEPSQLECWMVEEIADIDIQIIFRGRGERPFASTASIATNLFLNVYSQENQPLERGIRVLREKVSEGYAQLATYLAAGEWEQADRETTALMLKITEEESYGKLNPLSLKRFPCQDLRTLDYLWLYHSGGRFGLGIQVSIREFVGGNPLPQYLPSHWYLQESASTREVFSALAQRFIDCSIARLGIERSLQWLPKFAFQTVTVNRRGEVIKRETKTARYFTETIPPLSEGGVRGGLALDMVYIPGGTFLMGSTEGKGHEREKPQHQVTVPTFFMSKYLVTQQQWQAVASLPKVKLDLNRDPSHFKGSDRPVENINWYEAVEFCKRLSKATGRNYRLPSEAEWEHGCRAGTVTPFHFGETITGALANYNADYTYADEPKGQYRRETTPVWQFLPNSFGLYDMHGQVWEWCADTWHDNYRGATTDGSAWTRGGDNTRSPLRGGSWYNNPNNCRSANRNNYWRVDNDHYRGFRVVCVSGRPLIQ